MAIQTIQTSHYRQSAVELLAASDAEFDKGDVVSGAQNLWHASVNTIKALADENEIPPGTINSDTNSYPWIKVTAEQLSEETGELQIRFGFAAAEAFRDFDRPDWMDADELAFKRPIVRDWILDVLAFGA